ncbi:hypothetical protein SBOR_3781 [Sclerotinia borealis F-4128]|uniref:glutathione-specific gamma-glutamylcyclotransferase n=1 Tax=Sclerotinia borealis (strain F-4128) TaxID=1432307 RepID=W9CMI4_SCLBF|nr:hypothetical protein SBOR_3781 [Sclerotinia borealis F-4128]
MGDKDNNNNNSNAPNDYSNSENEFWIFGYGEDHRGTPSSPGRVVTLISHTHWLTLDDPHPHPIPYKTSSSPTTSPTPSPKVYGTAYRILASKVTEVRDALDIREINGYTIHYTPFYPSSSSPLSSSSPPSSTLPFSSPSYLSSPSSPSSPSNKANPTTSIRTLVYIGTPDNAQFTGPQDPQKLAEHIWRSEGPSGLNRDYLWGLDIALDELSPESGDEHVKDLADRVRKIAERQIGVEAEASHTKVIDHELKKAPKQG